MPHLLATETQHAQHNSREDSFQPHPPVSAPVAAANTVQASQDTLHVTVPCERECPYCWGPETD